MLLSLSLKFPKKYHSNAKNCSRRQPHSHLRLPPRGPLRISAYTLYFQKLESSAYIFVAAYVVESETRNKLRNYKFIQFCAYIFVAAYGRIRNPQQITKLQIHSILCSGLQKTHLFCTRVRFDRLRSLRVIQGRWFWYQSKARIHFLLLLVLHCDYGFWDTATYWLKIAYFSYPSLIRRPRSLCSLWNFAWS